jgi:hypothetical protein
VYVSIHTLNTLHYTLLCRALKTKHETPKYGLIYHASLIGQSAPKHKGKVSSWGVLGGRGRWLVDLTLAGALCFACLCVFK